MTNHPQSPWRLAILLSFIFSAPLGAAAQTGPCPNGKQIAFPGAEGFGRCAQGGRGGRVIEVTSLAEDGAGTLRACLEATGKRTCVFRVGGAINLTRAIQVNYPGVTLAGQTAPGGGIAVNGDMLNFRTWDIIIRHIRIRNGDTVSDGNTATLYIWNPDPAFHNNNNTLWAEDVMVDHVSASWSSDDNIAFWGRVRNATIQYSITSESMKAMQLHPGQTGVTIHHNLMATTALRQPLAGGKTDLVNNVMYNYSQLPSMPSGWQYAYSQPAFTNIVNNYYKEGPWTQRHAEHWGPNQGEIHMLYVCNDAKYPNSCAASNGTQIHISGNILRKYNSGLDEPARIKNEYNEQSGTLPQTSTRHAYPLVATTSAEQAYTDVLAKAGAMPRDQIDTRVLDQVRTQTSIYPFMWASYAPGQNWSFSSWDPKTTVGWPDPVGGTAPADTDHDGMPDSWELTKGLNPNDVNDGALDRNADGYSNLEDYLNELAGAPVPPPPPPPTNTAPSFNSQPANLSVTAGQSATFSATVSGSLPITLQWQKNGAPISGASGTAYTTPATTLADNGTTYRLVATNAYGSATSNTATLTVAAAPAPPPPPPPPPPPAVGYALSASPASAAPGSAITVSWTAPIDHSATDWIAMHLVGSQDTAWVSWQYPRAGGSASGSLTFTAPVASGAYEFRYYLNNGYTKGATSNVVMVGSSAPPPPAAATDLNDDGATNISDVQLGINQALGGSSCTTGDIDGNGSCNIADVQRIINRALGL